MKNYGKLFHSLLKIKSFPSLLFSAQKIGKVTNGSLAKTITLKMMNTLFFN